METQKLPILTVGIHEYLVFHQKPFPKLRIQQIVRQAFRFLREISAMDIAQAGQIPQRLRIIRKIVVKVPDRHGDTQPLIARGFRDFKIGGKCAAIQKLINALCCIRPTDELGRAEMLCGISLCDVDTVVAIPCGKPAVFRNQTIAAIVEIFEKSRAIRYGLLLGELSGNFHACFIRIAACAQDVVNIVLQNERRKSGGRIIDALRCVDICNLFLFRRKQAHLICRCGLRRFCFQRVIGQLYTNSFRMISSACALQLFISPTHVNGSLAFSASVTPADCISTGIICSSLRCAVSSISRRCGNSVSDRIIWFQRMGRCS